MNIVRRTFIVFMTISFLSSLALGAENNQKHCTFENVMGTTWCGYSIRARLAANYLKAAHPEITILNYSLHNQYTHPLCFSNQEGFNEISSYPDSIIAFPTSSFNQYKVPYKDWPITDSSLEEAYQALDKNSLISFTSNATLDENNNVYISTVTEPMEISSNVDNITFEYYLLVDGIQATITNYYVNKEECRGLTGMDKYIDGQSYMEEVLFDEVVAKQRGISDLNDMGDGTISITSECKFSRPESYILSNYRSENLIFKIAILAIDSETGELLNSEVINIDPIQHPANFDSFSITIPDFLNCSENEWISSTDYAESSYAATLELDQEALLFINCTPRHTLPSDDLVLTNSNNDICTTFLEKDEDDCYTLFIHAINVGTCTITISSHNDPQIGLSFNLHVENFKSENYTLSTADHTEGLAGHDITIPLYYGNETLSNIPDIIGFETNISLENGISFIFDENDNCRMDVSDTKYIIVSKKITENQIRLVVYSEDNTPISSGTLLSNLRLHIDDNIYETNPSGLVDITFSNTIFSSLDSTPVYAPDMVIENAIYAIFYIPGDVDFDNAITIADVTNSINIIIGKTEASENTLIVADINKDGTLDLLDILHMINTLLNKTDNPQRLKSDHIYENTSIPNLNIGNARYNDDGMILVDVCSDNLNQFIGTQMELSLPDGIEFTNSTFDNPVITLADQLSSSHIASVNIKDSKTASILIYSLANSPFISTDNTLFTICVQRSDRNLYDMVNDDLIIPSCLFADASFNAYRDNDVHLNINLLSGTNDILQIKHHISANNGNITISNINPTDSVYVYDYMGNTIFQNDSHTSYISIPLTSGIYIVRINNQSYKINL